MRRKAKIVLDTLFIVWMLATGFSLKSPNDTSISVPDYEISIGAEHSINDSAIEVDASAWAWKERESGKDYVGVDLSALIGFHRAHLEASANFKNRQAQNILRGEVKLAGKVKILRAGGSISWDQLSPAICGFVGIRHKYLTGSANFYREGFESAFVQAKFPINLKDFIVIEPLAKYEIDRRKSQHYQIKLNVKLRGKYVKAN